MNYLERYRGGEYEQVWSDLQALGPSVRQEPHYSQAREVAAETMRRVRRNCELLVSRLGALGYVFGTYPDGSTGYYSEGPLVAPSGETRAGRVELEAEVGGPLPLSLVTFWEEVGEVDFVGMHPEWPDGLDPLVVCPPEAAVSLLYEVEGNNISEKSIHRELRGALGDENFEAPKFFAGLAPDDLHKDNVSGGDPYGVALPCPSADFVFLYEGHNLLFVPYLRVAILRWGGFPGLDRSVARCGFRGLEGRAVRFEPLESLIEGLEPF
jgi:hypothetical protein